MPERWKDPIKAAEKEEAWHVPNSNLSSSTSPRPYTSMDRSNYPPKPLKTLPGVGASKVVPLYPLWEQRAH